MYQQGYSFYVAGQTKTGDCSSGALGAVVGEIAAESYGNANSTDTINFAKLMGTIVAAATGGDVSLASEAAGNAAENNYLRALLKISFFKSVIN